MAGLDQYTKILLHFDGNLTDECGATWKQYPGNGMELSSNRSKFGGQSAYCSGNWKSCIYQGTLKDDTGSTEPASKNYHIGLGDFTVDWWEQREYLTADYPGNVFYYGRLTMGKEKDGKLCYYGDNVLGTVTLMQWVHRALCRKDGREYCFENGKLLSVGTALAELNLEEYWDEERPISIGLSRAGFIDEFRLSVGIARWTTDFTPPAAAYSLDDGYIILNSDTCRTISPKQLTALTDTRRTVTNPTKPADITESAFLADYDGYIRYANQLLTIKGAATDTSANGLRSFTVTPGKTYTVGMTMRNRFRLACAETLTTGQTVTNYVFDTLDTNGATDVNAYRELTITAGAGQTYLLVGGYTATAGIGLFDTLNTIRVYEASEGTTILAHMDTERAVGNIISGAADTARITAGASTASADTARTLIEHAAGVQLFTDTGRIVHTSVAAASDTARSTAGDKTIILSDMNRDNVYSLDACTVVMLHFEDGMKDECGNLWKINDGGVDSSHRKFGRYGFGRYRTSANQNKASATLYSTTEPLSFGKQDFAIDWWEFAGLDGGNSGFAQHMGINTGFVQITGGGDSDGRLYLTFTTPALRGTRYEIGDDVIGQWVHRAVCRRGSMLYAFKNGSLLYTYTLGTDIDLSKNAAGQPDVTTGDVGLAGDGWIDELRISVGTPRWTANFLMPDKPYGRYYNVSCVSDTDREPYDGHLVSVVQSDVCRHLFRNIAVVSDTRRDAVWPVSFGIDTCRVLDKKLRLAFDMLRECIQMVQTATDVARVVRVTVRIQSHTVRRIPFCLKGDVISVTISLQERTLSDAFSMQTVQDVHISDAVYGSLLDFTYQYLVEETSQQGDVVSVKGMYDIDKLLYTPFLYIATAADSALVHARRLAAGMGKSLQDYFTDFYPTSNYSSAGATYQNIIAGLFGWTDRLPQRSINVCIRGSHLCIVQRGMEPNTVDITPLAEAHTISRPSVDRQIMRSTWFATAGSNQGNATDEASSDEGRANPYTGTITFGDQSCSYIFGLLQSETHGNDTTTYTYTSCDGVNMYLSGSVKETADETVTTEYQYEVLPHDLYLAEEVETTVSKKRTDDKSVRTTRHHLVGNGWYGTSVEVDGVYQGSSLSQGKPGQKVSRYTVEQAGVSMQTKPAAPGKGGIQGRALFDTEFPVRGSRMLQELTEAIEWLDRKIQETVSMDIWQYDHVIDFTDAVMYEGHTYYLVSNTITRTSRELKQSITIVRWY